MKATFELESIELELNGGPIAGVDEAGRGPLAGPVVAAAVVLDRHNIPDGIADSKALDVETRRSVYQEIVATAEVGIGVAEVDRIDADNILNASLWAMAEAVARLTRGPRLALIDGNRPPTLGCTTRCIVQGDAKCLSIAAASIVAKVVRDAMMAEIAAPINYGFDCHRATAPASIMLQLQVRHHAAPSPPFKPVQLARAG
jgi:ribonuclease HII